MGSGNNFTEAKEGPLGLGERGKENRPGRRGQGGERHWGAPKRESHWVLCLDGIYLEVSGEDPNSIFITFPGASFHSPGLY